MGEYVSDLIFKYVCDNVNFKGINEDNIDKVAGKISIEFCKAYSPRKNWDIALKDIKSFIIEMFRDVIEVRIKCGDCGETLDFRIGDYYLDGEVLSCIPQHTCRNCEYVAVEVKHLEEAKSIE